MSKIYLKKTYDIDGNANYQFVKKYFWGLITRPICFNIVKNIHFGIYEVYVAPVIFTNIETAKNIGSYFSIIKVWNFCLVFNNYLYFFCSERTVVSP